MFLNSKLRLDITGYRSSHPGLILTVAYTYLILGVCDHISDNRRGSAWGRHLPPNGTASVKFSTSPAVLDEALSWPGLVTWKYVAPSRQSLENS